MFRFFLKSYRTDLLNFCGSNVKVERSETGPDCLYGFRMFENGKFSKSEKIETCHPNILKGVIVGKKAWGLWVDQWTDGIAEGTFTKYEILNEFEIRGIKIPENLIKEFNDRLWKKRVAQLEKRNLKRLTDTD